MFTHECLIRMTCKYLPLQLPPAQVCRLERLRQIEDVESEYPLEPSLISILREFNFHMSGAKTAPSSAIEGDF
ncbi:MAG: hypothetical protein AVDCRST_MAG26-989 [uncultured Chloroflexia bacterium]|uniref:Uncharacterized protein n=1 Tax=uncultured Chloroflexia bacterium TaxID=1672391 RepID=A0A6J4HRM6_9CHLR|nr:MAG: hypothetical protein AVDCRST_MAG26-989 [uncultured Chloroflexia bacterium]